MSYFSNRLSIAKKTFYKLLFLSFIILLLNLALMIHQTPWLVNMHSIEVLKVNDHKTVTKTEYGTIIANLEDYNIQYIQLADIPSELLNIFIAIEDARFYQHRGVDFWGVTRAAWNIATNQQLQGGSTITQQLARNLFLNHDRTLRRKFSELIITIQLERYFAKDEILEMYLNQIHFGKSYYGINRAARAYFGKEVNQLTLGEMAILAGMPKGPNLFFPTEENSHRALARQKVVLNRLVDIQLISQSDAEEAYNYLKALLSHGGGEQ